MLAAGADAAPAGDSFNSTVVRGIAGGAAARLPRHRTCKTHRTGHRRGALRGDDRMRGIVVSAFAAVVALMSSACGQKVAPSAAAPEVFVADVVQRDIPV